MEIDFPELILSQPFSMKIFFLINFVNKRIIELSSLIKAKGVLFLFHYNWCQSLQVLFIYLNPSLWFCKIFQNFLDIYLSLIWEKYPWCRTDISKITKYKKNIFDAEHFQIFPDSQKESWEHFSHSRSHAAPCRTTLLIGISTVFDLMLPVRIFYYLCSLNLKLNK